MLGSLLRQEFKVLARDRSLLMVVLITLVAVAYAIWSGSTWKAEQISGFAEARQEVTASAERAYQQLGALEAGDLSIREAPVAGLPNTVKTSYLQSPGPLEELSIGNADLRPRRADVAAMGRADDMFRNYQIDNPALLALGRFDLAFFTIYLMPLLIIGLSYGVLSSDRESGSLALLLAQPITAARLAAVRISFRTGVVVVAVTVAMLMAWLFFSPPSTAPNVPLRLLAWCGATAIYGAFWAVLVACVVARNGSSESNALTLLLAWAGFTLVLPALISLVAQTVSPIPSRLEYITTARAAENEANAKAGALLEGYLLDHPEIEATEAGAVAPYIKTFVLVQRSVEEAVAPVAARFDARLEAQQTIAGTLAFLSPASLAQMVFAELAGSSLERQRRFETEARALRQDWLDALAPPIIAGRRLTAAELVALPRPEFAESSTATVLRSIVAPTLLLILYTGVATALARRRFRRFTVTGA